MVKYQNMSVDRALDEIRQKRRKANPNQGNYNKRNKSLYNLGFITQLREFERSAQVPSS